MSILQVELVILKQQITSKQVSPLTRMEPPILLILVTRVGTVSVTKWKNLLLVILPLQIAALGRMLANIIV